VSIVVALTALGVFFQGIYLLTSIGLNITKRTQYYPIATIAAAAVNVGLNFLFIPRLGIVGAGWANAIAYAVQAALGYMLSQRFYPIAYEWGRIVRICAAATAGYLAGIAVPSIHLPVDPRSALAAVPDLLARGTVVVAVFGGLLAITGFFHAAELRAVATLLRKARPPATRIRAADSTEMAGDVIATDLQPPDEPDR
jgi:O-antigen/teichoic acid export membrane protein